MQVNTEKVSGHSRIDTAMCKEAVNAGKYRKDFWLF